MFCLFRNSRIVNPLNYLVLILSWLPTLYWLYFTLVEKSFLHNFFDGASLMVDLLLGLPIVLLFAIIIYAMVYWTFKVIIIIFAPYMIEKNSEVEMPEDSLDPAMVEEFGDDYWQKDEAELKALQAVRKDNAVEKMDASDDNIQADLTETPEKITK